MSSDSALTVVARFDHGHAAHIALQRLEAAGIAAFLQDEHVVGVLPYHDLAVGGVKVAVPTERLEEAREVLREIAATSLGAPGDDPAGLPRSSRRSAALLALCMYFLVPVLTVLALEVLGAVLIYSDNVVSGVAVCVAGALFGVWSLRRVFGRRPTPLAVEPGSNDVAGTSDDERDSIGDS